MSVAEDSDGVIGARVRIDQANRSAANHVYSCSVFSEVVFHIKKNCVIPEKLHAFVPLLCRAHTVVRTALMDLLHGSPQSLPSDCNRTMTAAA
jgi:hypothetical protein